MDQDDPSEQLGFTGNIWLKLLCKMNSTHTCGKTSLVCRVRSESGRTMVKGSVPTAAPKSSGQKTLSACHGGNPRCPPAGPGVREDVKLKVFKAMLWEDL